jgi:hypothetical protein
MLGSARDHLSLYFKASSLLEGERNDNLQSEQRAGTASLDSSNSLVRLRSCDHKGRAPGTARTRVGLPCCCEKTRLRKSVGLAGHCETCRAGGFREERN